MKRILVNLFVFALVGILNSHLHASTTVFVVSEASGAALQRAIDAAASGDTIAFHPSLYANGIATVTLTETIVINKNLVIYGPGQDLLVINGNGHRIFFVGKGNVRVENLRLEGGLAEGSFGGYGFIPGGGGAGLGGAVFVNKNAFFFGVNVTFSRCFAERGVGGIRADWEDWRDVLSGDERELLWTLASGGGGGFCESSSGRTGGTGFPLEDGDGGLGAKYSDTIETRRGGNGGFGAGGGGTYTSGYGLGGFGGGAGVLLGFFVNGAYYYYEYAENPGGPFGGNSYKRWAGEGAGLGGAIFVRQGGFLYLDGCVFTDNGIQPSNYSYSGNAEIDNKIHGKEKGGAIFVMDGATAKLRGCSFKNNIALNSAGVEGFVYNMLSDTQDVYGVINELMDSDVSAFPPQGGSSVPSWSLYDNAE